MLFQTFSNMLGAAEEIHFNIRKQGDGRLAVVITPVLNADASANEDEGIGQLRAALAFPLRVVATPAELDEGLLGHLQAYNRERQPVADAFEDAMARLKEAVKPGKQTALGKPAVKAEPAVTGGEPEAVEESTLANPDSLF